MVTGAVLFITMTGITQISASMDDFASVSRREDWLRHPVLGDPSFDTFERAKGNPVVRGVAPYEWPVNGFLLNDPVSGNWYLYGGFYPKDYAMHAEAPSCCKVFRSADKGVSWIEIGPIFEGNQFTFDGEVSPATHAPDVSVFYADGRYHMAYDWCTENTTWANAANPSSDSNSGAGYAWSEKPEGPFRREARPIATTRNMKAALGKYRRLYASTIIKGTNDWMVFTLTDSGPHFGWALLGMKAAKPEGPYSEPQLLLHPESDRFHPPLLEFFPAFVHEGHIYSPATSVAMNRNYQAIFRVPVDQAMDPTKWELHQAGSVWHGESLEHESRGIWGQTFSGFVADDIFTVMYPSRDAQGMGTLNIASRPWSKPFREQGFVISGHDGPSLALLKRGGFVRLEAAFEFGGTVTVLLSHRAPLGPNKPTSGSTLHPLTLMDYCGLEFKKSEWCLVNVDPAGVRNEIAKGSLKNDGKVALVVERVEDEIMISVDDTVIWKGLAALQPGALGFLAAGNSFARVSQFAASGTHALPVRWLHTEAILDAAQNMADWEERQESTEFRYGTGVVSRKQGLAVKWNVEGKSFTLWAPKGPDFGTADIFTDGVKCGTIDFKAAQTEASSPLFTKSDLPTGRHAVRLQSVEGVMPVDTLETSE